MFQLHYISYFNPINKNLPLENSYINGLIGDVEVPEEIAKANATGLLSNEEKIKNYPFAVKVEELTL